MTILRIADGQVLTPELTIERADVLVDREEGEILAVETKPEDSENPMDEMDTADEETLDASGGLVIPGLVNAHTHASMTLLRGYADDKPLAAWLEEDIWPVEANLTPADIRAGADLAAVEMIRSGTTAFSDMYFHVPEVAATVERSGLRARLGHGVVTVGRDEETAREDLKTSLDVASEYDGAANGRIRTAFMPHSLTTVGEGYLEEYVGRARDLGVPVHYHANETAAETSPIVEEHGTRPLVYAAERGLLEAGDYVAHAVHVDEREIDLLAESGASVIHCPASNAKLASGIAPVQRMLDAGVTVGLGTDGPASNNDLDTFDELRDAAMVGKLDAGDASAVPAEAAIGIATAGGADALGFDSGRIEAGRNADLAVLDLSAPHLTPVHDLVSHLAYAARGSDVRHTICDGQVLMRDRDLVTLDERAVCEAAADHATDLVRRTNEAQSS
ncbi:S-adenosylhomocysteine deaminase [Halobacteriales archaeon QS_8_65_32]|nr:MAG: S-adenosylhomocysteine deaminase [Halobacteriales archaeon QS_8_65_32]